MIGRSSVAALALAGALLSACGEATRESEQTTAVSATPRITTRVVESYDGVAGRALDMELMPNPLPSLSRGLVAVESGGLDVIDLSLGEVAHVSSPRIGALAAAPDFQLRGQSAPLLIGAGGELATPRAWVFLASENELVEVPLDPIDVGDAVLGMCAERATPALLDLVILTDGAMSRWRVRDVGGDALAAELRETVETSRPLAACAGHDGGLVSVATNGATRKSDSEAWGFSDGSDVAAAQTNDGWWAIVARPSENAASLVTPLGEEVEVAFEEGLNAAAATPRLVAASAANVGGPFSSGVLLVADDHVVTAVELGGMLDAAKQALRDGS